MSNRRQTLLVNVVQQRRFVMGAVLTTIILINLSVISAVIFNPLLLDAVKVSHIVFLACVETVMVFGIAYFSLILSHRIVGPTYALARNLKKLADGDFTAEVQLRKGDFHMEAAKAFNSTTEILRTKIKSIKSELAKLETLQNIDDDTRQTVEQLLHELAYFKTEPSVTPGKSYQESQITAGNQIDEMGELHGSHLGR